MTTTKRRIKKVYPALSAKERVAIAWEERKARGIEDPLLGATMPSTPSAAASGWTSASSTTSWAA